MEIMNKIDKLMSRVNEEDKIIVGNITICLAEYVTLVAKKEAKAQIYSRRNEEAEREVEEKYQKCIEGIKTLNSLSEEVLGEKFYEKEFERDEVEEFLQKLLNEIFKNRRIARK